MADDARRSTHRSHEHSPHILNAAAQLTGTCLAVVGLLRLEQATRGLNLLADNVLALSAFAFLLATVLAYFAVRRQSPHLHAFAEVLFGLGLLVLGLVLLALMFDVVAV